MTNYSGRELGITVALVAYLVIRIEAFLFDLKSGVCTTSLWGMKGEGSCPAGGWKEWNALDLRWLQWAEGLYGGHHIQAVIYFSIAVSAVSERRPFYSMLIFPDIDDTSGIVFRSDDLPYGINEIRVDSRRNVRPETTSATRPKNLDHSYSKREYTPDSRRHGAQQPAPHECRTGLSVQEDSIFCVGIWDPRSQDHPVRVRYQRLSGRLDSFREELWVGSQRREWNVPG